MRKGGYSGSSQSSPDTREGEWVHVSGLNQSAALKRWQQTGHDELSFAPFFCFREVSVRCVYDGLGDLMARQKPFCAWI